jgi:Do/DeqQ family serine protease
MGERAIRTTGGRGLRKGPGWLLTALAVLLAGCDGAEGYSTTSDAAEGYPATSDAAGNPSLPADAPQNRPASLDTALASQLSLAFRGAAQRTLPAVVYVQTLRKGERREAQDLPIPEPFRDFFGIPEGGSELPPQQATGTGFVFDAQGHVMTNHHVVAGADRVLIRLRDGREFSAELVGGDAATDVAVLELETDGEGVPSGRLGDSNALQVGDWVLALGNPLGLDFTVTAGIVSAKGRRLTAQPSALEAFIQTDAAINPGNSGGPLIDLRGRIVGINSAIFGAQRFVGYGFAVPINLARSVAEDLLEYGYVQRPRLGVSVSDVTAVDAEAYGLESVRGAEINTVEEGSPAREAGIEVGDVVLALDGQPVPDATALTTGLAAREPGDEVTLSVARDGGEQEIDVTLGRFDAEESPAGRRSGSGESAVPEAWLGFRVRPLTPQMAQRYGHDWSDGVVISEVDRYGAAAQAGVRPGQVLLEMADQEIGTVRDVRAVAEALESGSAVSLRVLDPEIGETIINFRAWR